MTTDEAGRPESPVGGADGRTGQASGVTAATGRGGSVGRRWRNVVLDRWPTALAVAPWAVSLGGDLEDSVSGFGEALLLLPMPYVIGATVHRPRLSSWPVLLVGMATITALRIADVIAPAAVLAAIALVLLVWTATSGRSHGSDLHKVPALGMVAFGAVALVGLAVDPDVGRYLVAAGWFLHGVWDFVYLSLDKVVLRSYAEWCGVFDTLVAAELIFLV
jgi:hypothetical protein